MYRITESNYDTTGTKVRTYGGNDIWTQYGLSGPRPPDDCCETCVIAASSVRVLFWPVDDHNTATQNISYDAATKPYTTVSDGFTFTSPSVYVAYENINAWTECARFGSPNQGQSYNTTVAYKPDGLSTSRCYMGVWETLNYTEMQYPPSNTLLTDCYMPGGKYAQPSENPNDPTISPKFSFPSDLSLLVPSWKSCTYTVWGVWDPPSTLGKATAMVAASASSLPASPGAQVSPPHAPATPTPDPNDPPGGTLNWPESSVDPVRPIRASATQASSGSGNQQDPQKTEKATPSKDPSGNNDRPKYNGHPSNEPSKTSSLNTSPPKNYPSKNDPGSNGLTSNNINNPNNDPSKNNPPTNDPPSNSDPLSNNPPTDKSPAGTDTSRNGDIPINNGPKNDPTSITATTSPTLPPTNAQSQADPGQNPAPNEANLVQSQGLGAQIASAFGYLPGSTASSVNNPNVLNTEPKAMEPVVNGSPLPVMAGGSPGQKAPNGAVIVAGQTVAQGSQATVSGAVVSVGSDNVAIDGTNHAFPPLAHKTPTPLMVGANTAQRIPNGGLVVASQTLALGGQATVAGVVVSVGSSEAVLDGTTHNLAPIAPTPLSLIVNGATTALQPSIAGAFEAPVINIGGQAMTLSKASPGIDVMGQTLTPGVPHQGSSFMIAGQTLTPGGAAITVSGIPISLPASQSLATIHPAMANEASGLWEGGSASGATPVTVGNEVFTPNPSAFAIVGTTISAGGEGVTIAGTPIGLQPSGAGLVVGSSTLEVAASVASPGSPTPITIGTQVFTPNPSAFAIAGTSISAGGPGVTIAGTLVSLQPSGAGLVVGSSTIALPSQSITANAITVGAQVFTPNPTGFSIASTMISAGGPGVTVDGTVVSLEASGGGVVVGSSTIGFEGSIRSATSNPSSAAASATSNLVAGDTRSMSTSGSVLSTSSGGGKTTSSQPTRAVSSDGHTHFARGMAGFLIILIANILALSI